MYKTIIKKKDIKITPIILGVYNLDLLRDYVMIPLLILMKLVVPKKLLY